MYLRNAGDKKSFVKSIFSAVAPKYDLTNDVMSLGLHRLWKEEFCSLVPNFDSKILDVAGGSGDIAFRLIEKARRRNIEPSVTICDINKEMIRQAIDRAVDLNILKGINYVVGDAENLPFADESFDYYTISFGIRNVSVIDKALSEARRVLKPGGKFLCLEFSKMDNPYLAGAYEIYSKLLPKIGGFLTGDEEAYEYLVESIKLFPNADKFNVSLKKVGFSNAGYRKLSGGIVAVHTAFAI